MTFDYDFTDATVEFVNDEANVFGDFGRFTHNAAEGPLDYYAEKIVFKFPQEHFVDNLDHVGEMQGLKFLLHFVKIIIII